MAYNQSDQFFEPSTDTDANFANSVAGQTNSFFLPKVYSKQVLNFFRKASVAEAITNTDYAGEISGFGDTVRIIKEPTITVYQYERGQDVTQTKLTDQEVTLVVDTANAFKFIVDDIETNMSHVNFRDVATSSAAYALRDAFDEGVIAAMFAGVSSSSPDHVLGSDSATDLAAGTFDGTGNLDIGFAASEHDPIDVMAHMARLLDEQNVPEEGRWFLASPDFYEVLASSSSKLLSVDYNAGQGSIRNGLVSSGKLRGFNMYKSNNIASTTNAAGKCLAGHISSTATAQTITSTEVIRDPSSFGDIVRGLHVYGSKVLRGEALVSAFYGID
ncbi:MAG: phage capsid protein [Candidatus Poseidoniales archaeon]